MKQEHFKKLRRMYLQANINTLIFDTSAIEITDGSATISLKISEKYFHALGAMHGAVYFKLLDDAAFFAVNSRVEDVAVLTTSFHLHFIRPVNSGTIKALGTIKYQSEKLFVAEASLFNDKGKEIAFGTGNFVKSKIELSEKIGYK